MIILISKKSNTFVKSFEEFLKLYNRQCDFFDLECPICHDNNFEKWGSYKRGVYYLDNNYILQFNYILIKRVRCKSCKKTHSLLPEIIVPYRQPVLDIILHSINDDVISYSFPFSLETINNWKRIFKNKFLPFLRTMFINYTYIMHELLSNTFSYYIKFFRITKQILMMTHRGIKNMACF